MKYFIIIGIFIALISCKAKKETVQDMEVYYTCSMHPQVMQNDPGNCPICHMELIKVKKVNTQADDQIMLSDQQVQLGNIKVDTIKKGWYSTLLIFT